MGKVGAPDLALALSRFAKEIPMKRAIGLLFVLITPLALGAKDDEAVAKELKALEGTWKVVGAEFGGAALEKDSVPDFTFIVAAGGKATAKTPTAEDQAKFTVDPAKDPKTIDNLHESGASKGQTQYGIYKLEGDTWTVCMSRPGIKPEDRPKSFDTKDTTHVVFVFKLD